MSPLEQAPFSTQPRVETAGTPSAPKQIGTTKALSVLNHESKRLERFTLCTRRYGQYNPFSTQPRVETAGTRPVRLARRARRPFQYSTTSRNGWNFRSQQTIGWFDQPFSTQPRVETAGTKPLLASRIVELETFSTQPRVETAGTPPHDGIFSCIHCFQYSTTSRNGWNKTYASSNSQSRDFQYSTTSRNGWNGISSMPGMLVIRPFSTQPRVETAGTDLKPVNLTAPVRFQYSTTSRNGWNSFGRGGAGGCNVAFQYSTTSRNGWNPSSPQVCTPIVYFQYSTTSRNGWNRLACLCYTLPCQLFQYSTTSRNGWNRCRVSTPQRKTA